MTLSRSWETIGDARLGALTGIATASQTVVLISSSFEPNSKARLLAPRSLQLSAYSVLLLEESVRVLRREGLLYVYGLPSELPNWGRQLFQMRGDTFEMVFKYWIAMEIDDPDQGDGLAPTHMGLLMFAKSRPGGASAYYLNNRTFRVPHAFCAACGRNVKDWGGKKHLMNPRGAALSDVWRDLPRAAVGDSVAPDCVLHRVLALSAEPGGRYLHVVQKTQAFEEDRAPFALEADEGPSPRLTFRTMGQDQVYLADCVSFLKRVEALYPEGIFDLAFADPPYNLKKGYDRYADARAERHYLAWCDAWLEGMARTLKPGGALFVLNLPKWAIHHAAFLNRHLEFRNWIAWDALSDPRGKLMPAHYALLYYTKPGANPVLNYPPDRVSAKDEQVAPPDSPKYCLRAVCVRDRKARGDDERADLSDVWFDIHRIKHKRDRDAHPCQLPEKLMERIIRLTTRRGDLVFDPFCGAGTTAVAATKLGRHFVATDLDENYVCITNEKLAAMKRHADASGNFIVPRTSVVMAKRPASKRDIEVYLQSLARKLQRVPGEGDVEADRPEVLRQIDLIYPTRSAAFKRSRVALAG